MLLTAGAEAHLRKLLREFALGAKACAQSDSPVATLLFILSSTEFLSLYYLGSRRPADARGTKGFNRFLSRYFPRFNRDARDSQGHFLRVRIPLLKEGGKAKKRLKIPAALIHLFHRGVLEDLVAPHEHETESRCVIIPAGRWGFQVRVDTFHQDFQDTLTAYGESTQSDPQLARNFLRRFQHLHE